MSIDVVVLARFLLTGIALLLAFLAAVTWHRRKEAPEATTFALLAASMAVYAFGYAGEIAQTTVAGAQRWLDVEYLALPWAGGLWVLAALRHNGVRVRLRAVLLFVIPVITFVGHYTNFHNLFYTAPMTLVHRGPFWVLQMERGPLSMLDNSFLLVSFLVGSWVYVSGFRHASPLYRKQAAILVLSSLLPFAGYFVFLANLSPWGLDIAPITLGLTCVLMFYGIFYCGIFDLAPVARNLIFNSIRDAVLVLDMHDRLLDFNPAACTLLPVLNKNSLGTEVSGWLAGIPDFAHALEQSEKPIELAIGRDAGSRFYEIRKWPLFSSSLTGASRQVGRAVIFAEVTAQIQLREELRLRAETDSLTGIANRRRYYQALETECLLFARNRSPFSVLMIDLDYFKEVNDQYGHQAGDTVLRCVAQRLETSLRKTDLVARYGGEEFSVLLPETSEVGAMAIAERIRIAMTKDPITMDGFTIPVSVSVGISSCSADNAADPEKLLKEADLALYRAKATGRNRVEVI